VQPLDIVDRIARHRDALRPSERRAAQAILDDLGAGASASIGELAKKAGVSQATITRLARAIGLKDVREMKVALARASAVGNRFIATAESGQETDAPPSVSQRVLGDIIQAMQVNEALLDPAEVQAAAGLLDSARMIYIFGMGGSSSMLSLEAGNRLFRLGLAAAAYTDGMTQRMVAASVQAEDVVLAFSMTGGLGELNTSCATAKGYGARLVALTAIGSPLAGIADLTLPVQTMETDFIFKPSASRFAMMMVLDVLMTELALLRRPVSQETLRRVKLALDGFRQSGNDRQPLGD
jgi:RpiR family carbohydrate utilization transcriptional regulator